MKRWLRNAALLAAAIGFLAFLVVVSGLLPINASSGHSALTFWVLEFGKRRSIATHTLGLDAPSLEAPWLVLKGAGHYHGGCRPCHGAPDVEPPRIAAAMTPQPADLLGRVELYDPVELFYVVKHGVKFTGMPAWPSLQRDDEVAAVVAFLLELPRLDAESYRQLVHGAGPVEDEVPPLAGLAVSLAPGEDVAAGCSRCHGATGHGRGNAAFPKLAGQKPEYLYRALRAYANAERYSGIMEPIAAALTAAQWRALAEHYSALPEAPRSTVPDAAAETVARGRDIATFGIPEKDVPSCKDCHGPEGPRRNQAYPQLAGQYADYLVLQLELFAAGRRGGSEYAHLMQDVAPQMNRDEMEAVAAYYARAAAEQ